MKIEVKSVVKEFEKTKILNNLNVEFNSGKIYGLVGRNGTGKSVFLKMLCGFYNTSSGEILYNGKNIIKDRLFPPNTRALIEKPSFIPDLTGYENLKLLASVQDRIGKQEIIDSLEKVNLKSDMNKKYYKYSLGMKQKLGIAQVLMENPDILIFDEPFNGIEEKTVIKLREILADEKKKGKLIIIASHIKEDIDNLCDEIYEFDDGEIKRIEKNITKI
jgi:ABC-2 type transport system ATP-binding protein